MTHAITYSCRFVATIVGGFVADHMLVKVSKEIKKTFERAGIGALFHRWVPERLRNLLHFPRDWLHSFVNGHIHQAYMVLVQPVYYLPASFQRRSLNWVIMPFLEEATYRWMFQGGGALLIQGTTLFSSSSAKTMSFAVASFLFADAHVEYLSDPIFSITLVSGMVFGVVRERSSFFHAVCVHSLSNIFGEYRVPLRGTLRPYLPALALWFLEE